MGKYNTGIRNTRTYVEDNPNLKVHALDCVPDNRPKGSWTNGVHAWSKATTETAARIVGWFHPPRLRNKGHRNRPVTKTRIYEEE